MQSRFKTLLGLQILVAAAAFTIPMLRSAPLHDSDPPITVYVRLRPEYVPPGTTLRQVVRQFHIRARDGDLLDVDGKVLEKGAFPGTILVNNEVLRMNARLTDLALVRVEHGHDRREPIVTRVTKLPGRQAANPQFYLGTAPGVQVVRTGKISGELVSSEFRPTAPLRIPKAAALTFDDGPNPTYTPRVLAILKRMHVHATFFTIGYLAQRYPSLIARERRAGMVVANHSWDHPNSPAFRTFPEKKIRQEMQLANIELASEHVDPHLFRPPGGSVSPTVIETARELGLRVVLWSVDPEDWRAGITWPAIVRNVLSNVHRGSIVIMHDGGGDQSATLRALPRIIRGIRKKHLRIVPVR